MVCLFRNHYNLFLIREIDFVCLRNVFVHYIMPIIPNDLSLKVWISENLEQARYIERSLVRLPTEVGEKQMIDSNQQTYFISWLSYSIIAIFKKFPSSLDL